MLNRLTFEGPSDPPALLIAHGLFGSARNWSTMAKELSAGRRVIAVDMRNHGDSPWSPSHSYLDLAGDLAEVIKAEGAPMDVLGHSMGGKAAMVLALTEPALVRRLVVGDIAPSPAVRDNLQYIDALEAVDLSNLTRRSEVISQLQTIDRPTAAFLLQSLDMGEKRWRLNLGTLRSEMDKIMGWPDPTGAFDGPTLFLTGAKSDYVSASEKPQIKTLFPAARFAKIPDAGHWLHADQPKNTRLAVETFLNAEIL